MTSFESTISVYLPKRDINLFNSDNRLNRLKGRLDEVCGNCSTGSLSFFLPSPDMLSSSFMSRKVPLAGLVFDGIVALELIL